MSNYSDNKKAIDAFRKELRAMLDDISEIDVKVLNKAVNEGVKVAKQNTNAVTGFMRRSWKSTPTQKSKSGAEKGLVNTADYSSFVNDGHRLVNGAGETVGWVKGQYMLEKAIHETEKSMAKDFNAEIERVNKKHDK